MHNQWLNKRLLKTSIAIVIILMTSVSCFAQIPGLAPQKAWDLNGYVKYMATYNVPDEFDNSADHLIHQRFNFEYRFGSGFRFNAGMRNRALMGDSLDIPNYSDFVALDNGYMDLNKNLKTSNDVIINSQFDRLFFDWKGEEWNARVGRFRINWAMNTVWNPNDLFNAYSIYDFDYEERAGSDAILVGKKLGFADGFELIASPNQDGSLNSYSGRYFSNISGWDYQLIAGKSLLDTVFGAGFATDWKGAGVRGELTWFDPSEEEYKGIKQEQTVVASIEGDYSLGGRRNWMGRVAWLYISNPLDIDNAQLYLSLPLSAKTLSFTKNTAYVDVSFDITPLNRTTLSASYYQDDSYFIGLTNSYSLANNWQLLGVIQRFDGNQDSLFSQTAATLFFANIKWSF
ncbi:hypothetical protein [Vibrio kyushuensis]|uniref:hypothetical protein n=1 Tax=Vibrio kyushuensis TaxID=2910249 RepID=UPI003D0ED12D